jgi:hypothetical protein
MRQHSSLCVDPLWISFEAEGGFRVLSTPNQLDRRTLKQHEKTDARYCHRRSTDRIIREASALS